jgi:hypothetical protein
VLDGVTGVDEVVRVARKAEIPTEIPAE